MTQTRIPTWKSQLQQASFRGVPFFVGDSETVIGRRNVLHEYPLRDTPYGEDLGRKAREYTINAYLTGDNVYAQSKKLIQAIEGNNTPGVLVHPTLGIRNVIPQQCRHRFNNQEGGIEYFVLTFVDAGQNLYPAPSVDTQSNAQNVTAVSITALQSSFASMFNTTDFNDSLSTRAQAILAGSASGTGGAVISSSQSFTGILGSILNRGAYYSGSTQQFSAIKGQITTFTNNLSSIIANPATLAQNISDIIAALVASYPNNPTQQLIALIKLFNAYGANLPNVLLTMSDLPVSTPNRIQMALNQQQIIDLIQIAALLQMVITLAQTDFPSRQDALSTLASVENLMEPKLLEVANNENDQAYNALNNARASMVLDILARAATLKTIITIRNNYPVPALVLAYRQYQDATQEADIVSRNNIANPVFVPPSTNIEILV